ncbi:hypothetical protein O3M35_010488 [Rhynocoris fuscipes]|uniref:L-aminoadipate-semialdehyde dehydrogenase-phosphopantetheinyl transferase n=1 Tax=Rhynocoris fuscipes TaxID=488301 RepID=A0AAW1D1V2_9HEMI
MCDKLKSVRWVFDCTLWKPTVSEILLASSCIQQEEKERLGKFVFQRDIKSSLIGRLMMRKYISEVCNKSWTDIIISRDTNGKPYYKSNDLPINFNVSHQGRYTILAGEIGDVDLGVDIMEREYKGGKNIDEFFRIMNRNFSNEEWKSIRKSSNEKNQINKFFRFWCLKESFVKATGTGITVDLQKISFNLNTESINLNEFVYDTEVFVDSVKLNNWIFQETLLPYDHCAAVAIHIKNTCIKINPIENFTFLDFKQLTDKAKPILDEDKSFCNDFFEKDICPN